MQDSDPSIDYEGDAHVELDQVERSISTKELYELRQKLEQMKAEELEEEMQHQLMMEGLISASKEKEHKYMEEINNFAAKMDETLQQSQEAEKNRENELTMDFSRHQILIDEIKLQRIKLEEEIDIQRRSAEDILQQRHLETAMKAKLFEEEMTKIQNDYDEKQNNLKAIAASEEKKHREAMAQKKSELVSKYKQLEEQFLKESQAKLESIEREHIRNLERLNAEAD